ncbi:MAG TPA: hypothetical protein VF559_06295 [Caulobacteraceae bacterium]
MPYLSLRPNTQAQAGRDWCGQAGLYLRRAGQASSCADLPPTARAVNYWGLPQDPARPWKGTPYADRRNGASEGGRAAFADARWAARAIVVELKDWRRAGARSASDLSPRLAAARYAPVAAERIASAAGVGSQADLQLFYEDGRAGPGLKPVMRELARAALGDGYEVSDALVEVGLGTAAYEPLGQDEAGFRRWVGEAPQRAGEVSGFEGFLSSNGVSDVLPTWQVLRTASDWRGCGAPFAVPPQAYWPNVAGALRLIRDRVRPRLGPVEAKSGYREPWMNVCAGGAQRSAHREFWALDLVPLQPTTRPELMARLCPVYSLEGEALNLGLGFYGGVRFHIDAQAHRLWASDNGHPYQPCAPDGSVNPPPNLPPPEPIWPPEPEPR